MNILAFDTSGESCSVALHTGTECFEKINLEPRKQAERLLPMIDEILKQAKISRHQLQGLALTHGPGAFTGIRIATSAAQGLAYALDIPVVMVSTLAALAQGAYRKEGWQNVLSAIDARMDEVYWGAYQLGEGGLMQNILADRVNNPEQVSLPEDINLGWYGAGSGWGSYENRLPKTLEHKNLIIEAIDIINLALPSFKKGQTLASAEVIPLYIRDKVVR